ncbi:hypothetical protein, partial [Thermogutta sp.]|uniref:hypothetical protein n=1 Tax=Thermogutta sp. TaxID=1962930 RepID=UPI00322035C3
GKKCVVAEDDGVPESHTPFRCLRSAVGCMGYGTAKTALVLNWTRRLPPGSAGSPGEGSIEIGFGKPSRPHRTARQITGGRSFICGSIHGRQVFLTESQRSRKQGCRALSQHRLAMKGQGMRDRLGGMACVEERPLTPECKLVERHSPIQALAVTAHVANPKEERGEYGSTLLAGILPFSSQVAPRVRACDGLLPLACGETFLQTPACQKQVGF